MVNRPWQAVFKKPLFELGPYQTYGPAPKWQLHLTQARRTFFDETNFPSAISLLGFCFVVLVVWYNLLPESYEDALTDTWVEFFGLTFDVLFILIIFAFFEHRRQSRQFVARQQETIEDFKKWDSDEARFRIAGAIRRLNRSGITDIDLRGLELKNFSFPRHDIKSICGSTFYDGTWGEGGSRDSLRLEEVDFSHVDCSRVAFSSVNWLTNVFDQFHFAEIRNCKFVNADLTGAVFDGARMEWTVEPPNELGVWHESEGEPPVFEPTHWPPFADADLSGASFVRATIKNADFREAKGLMECNFSATIGLETCVFDNGETKEAILKKAEELASAKLKEPS